jgi:hypothetical protein
MTPCRVTVMGPTQRWAHDIPGFLPILDPFLPCIPYAPFLSKGERDGQGDLSSQFMCTNLVGGDLSEGFPKAWTVFSQRMGRKQQRYAKWHSFLEVATVSRGYRILGSATPAHNAPEVEK